jgi:hypothetical protein
VAIDLMAMLDTFLVFIASQGKNLLGGQSFAHGM